MTFRTKYLFAAISLLLIFSVITNGSEKDQDEEIRQGVAIIKVIPGIALKNRGFDSPHFGIAEIDTLFARLGITKVERTYPHCLPPKPNGTDLTRIYTVYFPETKSVDLVCSKLGKLKAVEYAEPWYIQHIFLDHNDPRREDQWGLDIIEANDAHDVTTGDPSIVIAIIDLGMDMDHPDLIGNRWVNPDEDLNGDGVIQDGERNGRDDGNNGEIDDFYGWDFIGNDNDPEDTSPANRGGGHGSHTAGIASAVTNNEIGISSIGYSCSIMTVRVGVNGGITRGYTGIEYAARSGAHIISNSWGGNRRTNAEQEVIDYAYDQGSIVFASAGNSNNARLTYPANYNHVISVAATDRNDRKWQNSSYGNWVDISAPGHEILSAMLNAGYIEMSGTSMACPFAAGVASLILSINSELGVDEVVEILLEGADDIDDLNPNYRGRLGAGRINASTTVRLVGNRPRLSIGDLQIVDDENDNGTIDPGEVATLAVTIQRGEDDAELESIMVSISSSDTTINFIEGEIEFPAIDVNEEFTNDEEPFIVQVSRYVIPHTTSFTVTMIPNPGGRKVRKFEQTIGHPGILVIDDDGGADLDQWYYQLIEENGHGWARWDMSAAEGLPEAELMMDREMIIWMTGYADPPLTIEEREFIENSLEEGANILLIGKLIGDDESNHEMLSRYFGAQHDQDSVLAWTVRGLPGDRLLDEEVEIYLDELGMDDGTSSPSTMTPVRGADSLAIYLLNQQIKGLAGVYRFNDRIGAKTIYLGFAFEGLYAAGDAGTPPWEVLNLFHEWFQIPENTPLSMDPIPDRLTLDPVYPNPFNNSVQIRYSLPKASIVKLSVYDVAGRQVLELVDGKRVAGEHQLVWDAKGVPTGLYMLHLESANQVRTRKILLVK